MIKKKTVNKKNTHRTIQFQSTNLSNIQSKMEKFIQLLLVMLTLTIITIILYAKIKNYKENYAFHCVFSVLNCIAVVAVAL